MRFWKDFKDRVLFPTGAGNLDDTNPPRATIVGFEAIQFTIGALRAARAATDNDGKDAQVYQLLIDNLQAPLKPYPPRQKRRAAAKQAGLT